MRPILTTDFARVDAPADHGPVPMLQWLRIADLVIDDSYQREIRGAGRRNVIAIATDFQWIKFSPVVVSPVAGGKYAVIDGQHRTTAAALIGIEEVPCQVVIADRAMQAKAFAAINGSATKVTRQQVLHAAAVAGDPIAKGVLEACSVAGVVALKWPKQVTDMRHGETNAAGALEKVYRAYGRETLITALQCITETSNNLPGAVNGPTIRAIASVLGDHIEWRDAGERLFRAFDGLSLEEALDNARAKAARMRGVAASDLLEAAIIEHLTASLDGRRAA